MPSQFSFAGKAESVKSEVEDGQYFSAQEEDGEVPGMKDFMARREQEHRANIQTPVPTREVNFMMQETAREPEIVTVVEAPPPISAEEVKFNEGTKLASHWCKLLDKVRNHLALDRVRLEALADIASKGSDTRVL